MLSHELAKDARFWLNFTQNTWNQSAEHNQMRWRWLRHGFQETLLAQVYFAHFPQDLEQDHGKYSILALDDVLFGIALHDALGKPNIFPHAGAWEVSRNLLNKEQLRKMRQHHRVGYERAMAVEWLDTNAFPQVVYDIILYHHEKRDGSGPEGLLGDQIPYVVQGVTIIDQIISRCEPRAYHTSHFNLRGAFEDVNRGRDTLYHPQLIDNIASILHSNKHLNEPGLRWLGEY